MPRFHALLRLLLAGALTAAAAPAASAPDEIQVYTEEIDAPGELGVEIHMNQVPRGERTPAWPGATPSNRVLQVTPEFSYGLTRTLEAGLYLPVALAPGGHLNGNGARLRLKYIAPREDGARFFWGLNGEAGYYARRVSESRTAMEFRPIIGWRGGDWLFAFNPILDIDLSANASREPKFDPAVKVSRQVGEGLRAGFEYYGEWGPIFHRIAASDRAHFVYGVLDLDLRGLDLNVGLGRGYGNTGDTWVIKAIIALPLD